MTTKEKRFVLAILALGLSLGLGGCTAQVGDGNGDSRPPASPEVIQSRLERDAARERMVEMQRRASKSKIEANGLAAELKLIRAEYVRRLEELEALRNERDDALADLDDADMEIEDLTAELDLLMESPWRTTQAWNDVRAWMTPGEVTDILGHPSHIEPADDGRANVWFYGPEDDGYVTFTVSDDPEIDDHVSEIMPPFVTR